MHGRRARRDYSLPSIHMCRNTGPFFFLTRKWDYSATLAKPRNSDWIDFFSPHPHRKGKFAFQMKAHNVCQRRNSNSHQPPQPKGITHTLDGARINLGTRGKKMASINHHFLSEVVPVIRLYRGILELRGV